MSSMQRRRQQRHLRRGKRRDRPIWMRKACRKISDGRISFVIATGTWHVPVERRLSKRSGMMRILREKFIDYRQVQMKNQEKIRCSDTGKIKNKAPETAMKNAKANRESMTREPSATENEIHPSHNLRLCSVYFAIESSQMRRLRRHMATAANLEFIQGRRLRRGQKRGNAHKRNQHSLPICLFRMLHRRSGKE